MGGTRRGGEWRGGVGKLSFHLEKKKIIYSIGELKEFIKLSIPVYLGFGNCSRIICGNKWEEFFF